MQGKQPGESKFSISYNLRLLGELLSVYPRTSEAIFYFYLSVNFVGLLFFPVEEPWDRLPLAVRVIGGTCALVAMSVFLKLCMMLMINRDRTGEKFPGSLFVVSMIMMGWFVLFALVFFNVGGYVLNKPFPFSGWLVLIFFFWPFSTVFFWIFFVLNEQLRRSWPSWLPKE